MKHILLILLFLSIATLNISQHFQRCRPGNILHFDGAGEMRIIWRDTGFVKVIELSSVTGLHIYDSAKAIKVLLREYNRLKKENDSLKNRTIIYK